MDNDANNDAVLLQSKHRLNWKAAAVTAVAILCWLPVGITIYRAVIPPSRAQQPSGSKQQAKAGYPSAGEYNDLIPTPPQPQAKDEYLYRRELSPGDVWVTNRGFVYVEATKSRELSDSEVGITANGLPVGAWSSTLQPIDGWPNLFRDPATGKKYKMKNGGIVEETSLYAGLTVAQLKAKITLDSQIRESLFQESRAWQQQQLITDTLAEMRRANDIAEENARWQRFWEIQNRNPTIYGTATRYGNTVYYNFNSY